MDGREWTGAPLARRGEALYAPRSAVYCLGKTVVEYTGGLTVFPGNRLFRFSEPQFKISAGPAYPSFMRKGEMMLPVASVSKDLTLPYASGHFDAASNTVHVKIAADLAWELAADQGV